MSIKAAINEYGETIGRDFSHDRTKTVGASEIGLCMRRTCMTKKKLPTDAELAAAERKKVKKTPQKLRKDMRGAMAEPANWGAHVRGSMIEKHLWVPAMRKRFGKAFVMGGEDQKTLMKGPLSATPDGLVVGMGHDVLKELGYKVAPKVSRDIVVECKSIDPRVNLVEEKAENAFQVQVQMGLIRDLTKFKPDMAVISYVDASFWHEVAEFVVPFDAQAYAGAEIRAGKILNAEPTDLKPEGWITGGKECGWCPYAKQCTVMRGGVPESEGPTDDPQFVAEIIDLCKQANRIQVKAKDDASAFRDIQNQIKDRLREKGVRKIPGIVNWFNVKGRENYDVDAMIEALEKKKVDTEQFREAGEPTNSLMVDKKVALL